MIDNQQEKSGMTVMGFANESTRAESGLSRGNPIGGLGVARLGVLSRQITKAGRAIAVSLGVIATLSLAFVACDNAGADRVLSIEATGYILGAVYFDGNGTREFDTGDTELSGVVVSLVTVGATESVATATSDDLGAIEFSDVPVGKYQIVVDASTIGDTSIVARIDSSELTVVPVDTQIVSVAISFPLLPASEAMALPVGTRTFVDGIALTAGAVFGDSTLHVADTSGSIRAVRVGTGEVFAGDSVRLRGIVGSRMGQPVLDLDRRSPQVLAIAELPAPDTLTTAAAAAASAGSLDAAFVRIDSARVIDSATVNGDYIVTVNDGSGPLSVNLDRDLTFDLGPYFIPGVDLAIEGLLVPMGGTWQLKPRGDADVEVKLPVLAISEARATPPGQTVFFDGKVLTSMAFVDQETVFGDSIVHVADTSAAIRVTEVRPMDLAVGDSVRVVGRTAVLDGQVVVEDATIFMIASSIPPLARTITAAQAATAGGGTFDAALIRIDSARITDTSTVGEDFVITVDDGLGTLEVVFDGDVTFDPGPYFLPGADIEVSGVLVSTGASWQLKPRGDLDVDITAPVLAISTIRSLTPGRVVFLDGKVITAMAAQTQATVFGDSTVHVADTSGAIRITRLRPLDLFVGDSVRFVGTTAISEGQVVVDRATAFPIASSYPPLSLTVTTAEAANANGGVLDAAFVRIHTARVTNVTIVGIETVVTATDGSGPLEIVLDASIQYIPDQYLIPGADVEIEGVLVPTGTAWQLKPRGSADIEVSVPVVSVELARTATAGEIVFVDGTALLSLSEFTGRTPFLDSIMHLADPSGAIRATQIVATGVGVTPGDSVRIVGTVSSLDGQPVLADARLFMLEETLMPLPFSAALAVSTAGANSANNGLSDAAFVFISTAAIISTTTVNGDFHATMNDGSGPVVVVFDGDYPAFDLAAVVPGSLATVYGVLVADGTGSWVLKPRNEGDVEITVP